MNGRVTAGRPAGAVAKIGAVVDITDVEPSRPLHFAVTLQTKIHVPLHQHFGVDGAMRVVANGAALPQSRVLEHVRLGFFAMAVGAVFVEARHR